MECWNTGTERETADNCSFTAKNAKDIVLTPEMYAVTRLLCEKYPNDEWQIMLIGEVREKDVLITDYYIPKQEVGGASVKNKDCIDREMIEQMHIVGTMHSHDTMSTTFSQTDKTSTNNSSTLEYHVVTNNKGDFNAVHRITLPCGLVSFAESKVIIQFPEVTLKGVENITVTKYVYSGGLLGDFRDYDDVHYYCNGSVGAVTPEMWDKQLDLYNNKKKKKMRGKKDKRYQYRRKEGDNYVVEY